MATTKKTIKKDISKTAKSADQSILHNPRITEKAANLAQNSIYLFDVAYTANKSEIAKAFVLTYKQTPLKINIVNQNPKSYFRGGILGFAKRSKKAYIVLPKGTTIEIM